MVERAKMTLQTRHTNCLYCIALSFFILSIVLFALTSEQSKVINKEQSRTPVIICASIILILSVVIVIWVVYYTTGCFRLKNREQLTDSKTHTNRNRCVGRVETPVIIFDNAAFQMDDPSAMDTHTNNQTSA